MTRSDCDVLSVSSASSPQRIVRVSRGVLAAVFSTFIALASHVLAGGDVPGLLGIVVPLVFATSSCIALAGLRKSWLRLSVSVGLSQLLFHTLFVIGASSSMSVTVSGGSGGHAGHGADQALMIVGTAGTSMSHGSHPAAGMMAAHGAAALITVVTLQRGEAVLNRLLRLTGRLVAVLLVPVVHVLVLPVHPLSALSSLEGSWRPSPLPVVATGTVRRGPPALSLAWLSRQHSVRKASIAM